jgi:hypothetical protein
VSRPELARCRGWSGIRVGAGKTVSDWLKSRGEEGKGREDAYGSAIVGVGVGLVELVELTSNGGVVDVAVSPGKWEEEGCA